jgi:non-heme chloroperoxidase
MPYVRSRDGHSLFVRVVGHGEPCLLVHGFASDSRSWLPFVAPFTRRYSFVIPDLRGFGRSHEAPLSHDCPLTQFAEDIEDSLAALAIPSLPVIGISMGAFTTVQSFRLFGGERFSRYLHVDQGPVIHNRADYAFGMLGAAQGQFFARLRSLLSDLEQRLHLPFAQLPRALQREFWAVLAEFSAAAFSTRPLATLVGALTRRERFMRSLLRVERWQSYIHIVRAYLERDYDLRDGFRAIGVPLTVLIGGRSRMYPPAGQRTIGALAPHARIREIAGAGHMIPYEAPRTFLRELGLFLAGDLAAQSECLEKTFHAASATSKF